MKEDGYERILAYLLIKFGEGRHEFIGNIKIPSIWVEEKELWESAKRR